MEHEMSRKREPSKRKREREEKQSTNGHEWTRMIIRPWRVADPFSRSSAPLAQIIHESQQASYNNVLSALENAAGCGGSGEPPSPARLSRSHGAVFTLQAPLSLPATGGPCPKPAPLSSTAGRSTARTGESQAVSSSPVPGAGSGAARGSGSGNDYTTGSPLAAGAPSLGRQS